MSKARTAPRKQTVPLSAVMRAIAAWETIPSMSLGDVPEKLMDKHPVTYRQIIAKRAMVAGYEDPESDPAQAVQDALADLRHLCDALGLDFAKLDRAAYAAYIRERNIRSTRRSKRARS